MSEANREHSKLPHSVWIMDQAARLGPDLGEAWREVWAAEAAEDPAREGDLFLRTQAIQHKLSEMRATTSYGALAQAVALFEDIAMTLELGESSEDWRSYMLSRTLRKCASIRDVLAKQAGIDPAQWGPHQRDPFEEAYPEKEPEFSGPEERNKPQPAATTGNLSALYAEWRKAWSAVEAIMPADLPDGAMDAVYDVVRRMNATPATSLADLRIRAEVAREGHDDSHPNRRDAEGYAPPEYWDADGRAVQCLYRDALRLIPAALDAGTQYDAAALDVVAEYDAANAAYQAWAAEHPDADVPEEHFDRITRAIHCLYVLPIHTAAGAAAKLRVLAGPWGLDCGRLTGGQDVTAVKSAAAALSGALPYTLPRFMEGRPLEDLEREAVRLWNTADALHGEPEDEHGSLCEQANEADAQIFLAPCNSPADAAVKLRRILDADIGIESGCGPKEEETAALVGILRMLESMAGRPRYETRAILEGGEGA